MSERPKERASKARDGQPPSEGSNPSATAMHWMVPHEVWDHPTHIKCCGIWEELATVPSATANRPLGTE